MRRLRAECPWKRAQTHRSLVRYLIEEAHETAEAIETGTAADVRDELGDLLLQVYFHAAIAEETGAFTLDDVASGIVAKMRRRNPHVFGDAEVAADPAAVNELWESVKAGERERRDVADGIAVTLPALLRAAKVLERLERAGRGGSGEGDGTADGPVLLLVPSPLLGPATWGPVAWWLRGRGHEVVVADPTAHPPTPAGVVESVLAAAAGRAVVLVVHSNAGLFAPLLAERLDVRATVYVDAALADGEGGVAAGTPLAPPWLLDRVRALAGPDDVLPPWTAWWDDDAVAALLPDPATRAAVEAEQRRLPLAYLASTVPVPDGWTTAPAAYLALGDGYADEREQAGGHGWPVATLPGGHLHQLVDPAAVGGVVLDLLERALDLPPADALGDRLLGLVAQANERGVDPEQALRDAVRRRLAAAG
ncbi:hypothetical protein GCM10023340_37030 [Nocardioides marinquilinus]|uniref:NTP pyrophosphohydrolase MazG-like domain-containing protein n=2 Tax=Nocardioides marinquilinus TaxID=1210400 RepID=A0ABP9PYB2_9ACTN